ncbi:MAG: diguanylate cyclase domain-containing protein [Acidimicrobiales bacterium]
MSDSGVLEGEQSLDARVALGKALDARATDVGCAVNDRLRSILKLGPEDPLPEVNAAVTSELATRIVARYLENGSAASSHESQLLARPGSLALHQTSMTTLLKLFLAWRDVTLLTLRDLSNELATPPQVLQFAEEVTRASCDASLVRMTKRFEDRRIQLEAMLAEEHRTLQHEASHDPLTGLLNRGAFLDLVRNAGESNGPDESIALMFIDLDGFKATNDTHGHDFGDLLLQAVAARLNEVLRPNDTAGRIGGDEFVVLCRQVRRGTETAFALAQRLCDFLGLPFEVEGTIVSCPASVGLVCANGPVEAETLLSQADAALYSAKRAGKARVVLG